MKKILLLLIIILAVSYIHAQEEKSMVLSLGQGKITTPSYDNNKWGNYYSFELDYSLTKRQVLTSGLAFGSHRSYNEYATSIAPDGTNHTTRYNAFSLIYKYKLICIQKIDLSVGAGASYMTNIREYTRAQYPQLGIYQSGSWTLSFPVRLDAEYKLTRRVRVGVMGGVHVEPDYPIMTHYGCLKLGILLK